MVPNSRERDREGNRKRKREGRSSQRATEIVSLMCSVLCVVILEIRFAHEKSDVQIKALLPQPPLINYPRVS